MIFMSTESLNRTSNIDISNGLNPTNHVTPQRVNIDVLKRRVRERKKKERLKGKIIIASLCVSIGFIGYLVN